MCDGAEFFCRLALDSILPGSAMKTWMKNQSEAHTTMARRSSRMRLTAMVCALTACLLFHGCNYVVMIGYLIGGPPSIEPEFDAMTKESMTDKDVKVAVVCYAPKEVRFSFEDINSEVSKFVTFRLDSHKIKTVPPDYVKAWLDQNPDWDRAEEIGAAFKARYVVYIDLKAFSLYEEGSASLYRGRSEAIVSVWKMDDSFEAGEKIFSKEIISKYPLYQPKSAADETLSNFKALYMTRLSEEIGRLFYEHYTGDDMGDAT